MLTREEVNRQYYDEMEKAKAKNELPGFFQLMGKRDLFFLILHILKRIDIDRDWLYERCTEVQKNPDGYLDLWFREGYKSSIITYGLTIQDILNDPTVTVGIFSYNRPTAKAFLRQIKREFEVNEFLKGLYPDILWSKPETEAPKWSEDEGIIVKRKVNPKEATIEAWGLVDGQPTGRHFNRMIYDDVVTLDSVSTPEMMAKTTRAWEMSRNLFSEGGKTRYIGTRYHYNDTYGEIMRRGVVTPRIYPVWDKNKNTVLLSRERVEQKRKELGPYVFSSQMLQDPVADEAQNFKEEWLQTWNVETTKNLAIYILVDPASKKKKNSDYTAMFVIGLGADKNYYIIDMIRDRLNLTEKMQVLFALHKMYHPIAVGYEEYGMQSDIEHLQYVMNKENYRFPVYPLGGQVAKEDRIRALVPIWEQKRVFLPMMCIRSTTDGRTVDLTKVFIEEEYKTFPVGAHDDMLDCLARILDHGKKGIFAVFPDVDAPSIISRPPRNATEVANLEREGIFKELMESQQAELELMLYS